MVHLMMVNFRSGLMVVKKGILLISRISTLMLIFLLDLTITVGNDIYSVTTVSGLVQMVSPLSMVMLGP